MSTATARTPAFQRAVFEDGLGTRHHADAPTGEPLELLELREEFRTESFESALRERVAALATFQTTFFAPLRGVQRHQQNAARLFVLSDRVAGARLSNVLAVARSQFGVNASLCLVRQLMAAIALLHEKLPGIAHGAISTERVLITPRARLVVVDYTYGLALERLGYESTRFWEELRIPMLPSATPAFDQRTDVLQIGIMALELILGRPIEAREYPDRMPELIDRACDATSGEGKPLPVEFRGWLLRMLQLDTDPFRSAVDAWADLEQVLVGSNNAAAFAALEAIMADYARKVTAVPAAVGPQAVTRKVLAAVPPRPPEPRADDSSSETAAAVSASEPLPPPPQTTATVVQMPRPVTAVEPPATVLQMPRPELELPFAAAAAGASAAADAEGTAKPRSSASRRWMAAAAAIVLLAASGAFVGRQYFAAPAAAAAPGLLVVTTNPSGYQVFIDGQPRGVTPLTIELAAGSHELKLATEGEPRIIPITIQAGSTVSQTLELPKAAPRTGQLMVRSEPAGARVTLDGQPGGTTPLTIDNLEPGTHRVTLESDIATVTQEVIVEAGVMASLVVPMTAPQGVPVSGWIVVEAPAEVQIYETGQLLGTSRSDRLMVSAGRHDFEFVNPTLGYRSTRTVTVAAGKVSPLRLEWPKGAMAINAQPWADVWINGERIGETPIGNVVVPIGTHEVVFRHPELGEQIVRATVTTGAPARVSADMRKR